MGQIGLIVAITVGVYSEEVGRLWLWSD